MRANEGAQLEGRHVAVFSWRDTDNPEAGGAEHYLHQITAGLVGAGARVTVFTAAYPGARAREERDGIRYVRRGGKLSIYLWGVLLLALGRLGPIGRVDAVIDVQNGLPFFCPLGTRAPVTVLVHHVHREQWPVRLPRAVRTDRLVGRVVARTAALPSQAVRRGLPRHPGRAGHARRRPRPGRGRAQRRRAGAERPAGEDRASLHLCRRAAGAAQAGRARRRRGGGAAGVLPGPEAEHRGQRLVGRRAGCVRLPGGAGDFVEMLGHVDEETKERSTSGPG